MHKMEVYVYWNKKCIMKSSGDFDRGDLMPNIFSECTTVLEHTLEKHVNNNISLGSGVMDVIVVVNENELCRTGNTTAMPFYHVAKLMETISISFLRSFDNLVNERPQDFGAIVMGRGLGTIKFDKDKAFHDTMEFFKN